MQNYEGSNYRPNFFAKKNVSEYEKFFLLTCQTLILAGESGNSGDIFYPVCLRKVLPGCPANRIFSATDVIDKGGKGERKGRSGALLAGRALSLGGLKREKGRQGVIFGREGGMRRRMKGKRGGGRDKRCGWDVIFGRVEGGRKDGGALSLGWLKRKKGGWDGPWGGRVLSLGERLK